MKRLTVSILGSLPPVRALSSYCFELTRSLLPFCDVKFLSFKAIYPAFLYPGGTPDDDNTYPEIDHPGLQTRRRLTWYNPLSWLIEGLSTKSDLLHAQWWSLPLFPVYFIVCGCFKLRKKPVLFTIHNVLPHEKSTGYIVLSRLLFRMGDHFIVHTGTNRNQLTTIYKIPGEMISVIPHGSLDFLVCPGTDGGVSRKTLGFSAEDKIVLLFGAIRPYKGIDTAIEAFARVAAQVPGARLLIAGRLWEPWTRYEHLIQKLDIAGQVACHLDYIPSGEVHAFFEVADLCIFPYHHFDSQSGAGAAALSFRKPMIVSDAGGLPDLVNDRQWVVPAGDTPSLAQAIVRCLEDPALLTAMAADATQVAEKFSWPVIAEKTDAVYRRILRSS